MSPFPHRTLASALAAAWILLGVAVAAGTVVYAVRAHSPVQLLDQWDEIVWLERFLAGEESVAGLWRTFNQHSPVFPRLIYLTDLLGFRGSNAFVNSVSLALQATTTVIFIRVARSSPDLPRPAIAFLTGAYLIVLMSATQMENFTWGYDVQNVMVMTAAVGACAALGRWVRDMQAGASGRGWMVAACALAFVSTFSMAHGVLTWPVLVLAAAAAGVPRPALLRLGAVAVAGIALRVAVGFRGGDVSALVSDPLRVVHYFSWMLGSPFRHASLTLVALIGALGVALAAAIPLAFLLRRRPLTPLQCTHLAILAFTVGGGLAISVGRAYLSLDFMLNSRYATPALIFWSSAVTLLFGLACERPKRAIWASVGLGASVAAVLILALIPAHFVAGRAGAEPIRAAEHATLALIVGVEDRRAYDVLYPQTDDLRRGLPFVRARRLGLFAAPWAAHMDRPLADLYPTGQEFNPVDPEGTPCIGRFESLRPVEPLAPDDAAPGGIVEGWAWNVETRGPVALVLIVNEDGIVRGIALPGLEREDVATDFGPELPGSLLDSGWAGFVASRHEGPLRAYAVTGRPPTAYPLLAP